MLDRKHRPRLLIISAFAFRVESVQARLSYPLTNSRDHLRPTNTTNALHTHSATRVTLSAISSHRNFLPFAEESISKRASSRLNLKKQIAESEPPYHESIINRVLEASVRRSTPFRRLHFASGIEKAGGWFPPFVQAERVHFAAKRDGNFEAHVKRLISGRFQFEQRLSPIKPILHSTSVVHQHVGAYRRRAGRYRRSWNSEMKSHARPEPALITPAKCNSRYCAASRRTSLQASSPTTITTTSADFYPFNRLRSVHRPFSRRSDVSRVCGVFQTRFPRSVDVETWREFRQTSLATPTVGIPFHDMAHWLVSIGRS